MRTSTWSAPGSGTGTSSISSGRSNARTTAALTGSSFDREGSVRADLRRGIGERADRALVVPRSASGSRRRRVRELEAARSVGVEGRPRRGRSGADARTDDRRRPERAVVRLPVARHDRAPSQTASRFPAASTAWRGEPDAITEDGSSPKPPTPFGSTATTPGPNTYTVPSGATISGPVVPTGARPGAPMPSRRRRPRPTASRSRDDANVARRNAGSAELLQQVERRVEV